MGRKLHRKLLLLPSITIFLFLIFILTGGIILDTPKYSVPEIEEVIFVTRKSPIDAHWYANFGYYALDSADKRYEEGSSLCKLNIKSGTLDILFKDVKGTFRDPQLHYNGKKILFSYRKGGEEYFHLYETDTKGSFLRQLTSGPFSDIEPTYLPDDDIIFVSSRCNRWVNCWTTQVATLYRCRGDGSGITPLSANIEQDNTPWVLPSGQIMYTRWEYVQRSQVDYHHLWVMNPDGTRQTVLYGNQISVFENTGSCLLIDAKPVPWSSDTILATFSPGHGQREHRGYPIFISLTQGPDDKEAMKFIQKNRQGKNMVYDPIAINRNLIMASRDNRLLTINEKGNEKTIFDLPKDFLGGNQMIFEPRPVTKRKKEPIISSHLKEDQDYGTIILQDVYVGRNMAEIEPGSISDLLVLETLRKPINFTGGMEPISYNGTFTLDRIIGTVSVHEDGSAYFNLPANIPVHFIAIDDKGSAVQSMKSFTSVKPGEVVSCIGCHEKRSFAPENKGHMPIAMSKTPDFPVPVVNVPAVIDFPKDIQPILDRHCVKCHNPEMREGGILLTGDHGPLYSHSYFTLMAHFQVNDGINHVFPLNKAGMVGDRYSKIIEKVENGHGEVKLSEKEVKILRYWINTGASYPGTYAALGSGMVGETIGKADSNGTYNMQVVSPVQNKEWIAATAIIEKKCQSCHSELMNNICSEENLSFWSARKLVSGGWMEKQKYKEAIRFSRHIIYNLDEPEKSTALMAPLSKDSGGYGLCIDEKNNKSIFDSRLNKDYLTLLEAIMNSSEYLDSIKRFDMIDFVVRPEYYREMKRYGVLDDDVSIEEVNPYKTDSIYWEMGKGYESKN